MKNIFYLYLLAMLVAAFKKEGATASHYIGTELRGLGI